MPSAIQLARAMHGVIEPFHSILYFAKEAMDGYEGLGLEPRGQGYVAGRTAPLGAVGPAAAAAVFYNFNPALFDFALPAAWDTASPEQVLRVRAQAMEQLYQRTGAPTEGLAQATELARLAAAAANTAGRPLAAANKAVDPPGTPFADLWQAMAVLREHRGDGHVALLTTMEIEPVQALVLYAGWQNTVSRRFLQSTRLWDDAAWEAGMASLQARDLIGEEGLTSTGRQLREQLELRTDELAAQPWQALGEQDTMQLFDLMLPIVQSLNDAGAYPRPVKVPSRP
ncbi:MAG: SCO6745 family protein [Euzebya sp.]